MSYRNSFCTEFIYNQKDFETVYKALSERYDVWSNSCIINGFIRNTWGLSTPWDLKEALSGVHTEQPVTFATISENGDYARVDTCVFENGVFDVKTWG